MRPVSDAFNAAVRRSHQRIARVTMLDTDLVSLGELGGTGVTVGGTITMDTTRRRTCSLSLVDPLGELVPVTSADPLFPNRLLRVERGIVVDGVEEYVSLGVFMVDRPVVTVTPAGPTIEISGQDRLKLALKSRFTVPTTFGAGEPIGSIVQSVLQTAGMGASLYRLEDAGKVLAADRTFETDADVVPSMVALAVDFALQLYVDADGYVVLEPAVTADTIPAPSWVFERGADATMLGITKELSDDRLYNHVRAVGEGADLPPVAADARDLNPASPAYNPIDGSGPIGDRLFTHVSAMIRSIEQAAEVAAALLPTHAFIEELIRVPSVVHPALEVGDAVTIIESLSRVADTYLLDAVSMPVGAGEMVVSARKLRALS